MKTCSLALVASLLVLTGCKNVPTADHRRIGNTPNDRVTYVGSNIPRGPDQYPIGQVSANIPRDSIYRKAGDLRPSEPVTRSRTQGPVNDVEDPYANGTASPAPTPKA